MFYTCSVCKKTFANKQKFNRHLSSHVDEQQLSCTQCDYQFVNKSELKKHLKTHIYDLLNLPKNA